MSLKEHQRNKDGRKRKERTDSLAGNLAKEYPEFKSVNPRTKLGTLEKKFGVRSVNKVRKSLRQSAK